MAIDRSVNPAPLGRREDEDTGLEQPGAEMEVGGLGDMEIVLADEGDPGDPLLLEDGSMEISLDDSSSPGADLSTLQSAVFDADLSRFIDENVLHRIANDLLECVDTDAAGRRDWEEAYRDGIKLLGIKPEEVDGPWEDSCGLTHPMLMEAVVRFQSETIMETMPASGPVRTNIIGEETPERKEAARRVRDDMNWQLMEEMPEYRTEHERMLWNLPLAGSAFKKVYYDPGLGRQVSMFVPAEDIILPYGASDLSATCPRITHRMKKTEQEVTKLQNIGFYRSTPFIGSAPERDEVEEAKDEETGVSPADDTRVTILEIHTELDLYDYILQGEVEEEAAEEDEGDGSAQARRERASEVRIERRGNMLPYVVTIDKASGQVLSIYRNWKEGDPLALARKHFVHYQYVPGFGAYGFGLIHLVGNYARGATAFLRQLGDAGTLSNLPGGFKTRGMRVKNENQPIAPGEWRDVDVASGTLSENIVPLPYKEPSQTLFALLGAIVEDGRRLAATADLKISDMSSQTPVGTILAVLERMLKVMSAVQARVHYAMKQELRLLRDIIRDYVASEYAYDVEGQQGRQARVADYAMAEVYPVSDPNASTMSQRIVQYQAVHQLAQTAPQIYDQKELHRQMLDVLGVREAHKLIPMPADMQPVDPVSENMAVLTMQPVKAFIHQDHEAHISTHMAAMQDPMIMQMIGQNPNAKAMQAAMMAHISEHLGFLYRAQIEQMMGVPLPPPGQPLPPEVEVQLSRMVAQAAQKLLGRNIAQEQAKAAQQAMQDPVLQNAAKELEIKDKEVNRKMLKDLADAAHKAESLELKREEQDNAAVVAGMKAGTEAKRAEKEGEKMDADGDMERSRFAAETMRDIVEKYLGEKARREDRQDRAADREAKAKEPKKGDKK